MAENRMSGPDWGFVALAAIPILLVFVAPGFLDKPSRLPVTYAGVGLGVVLSPIGLWVARGSLGRRRTWLMLSVGMAAFPFVLFAGLIGLQWALAFIVGLVGS